MVKSNEEEIKDLPTLLDRFLSGRGGRSGMSMILRAAIGKAAKGHRGKKEVRETLSQMSEKVTEILDLIESGNYKSVYSYRSLTKINPNGKRRDILSPDWNTRILQHLLIQVLYPEYAKRDNGVGINCKPGSGMLSKNKKKSGMRKLKTLFSVRSDLSWTLVIDQRKCYQHVTPRAFRKALFDFLPGMSWRFYQFAIDTIFVGGKVFPIGTPTSPIAHHILMYRFDQWVASEFPWVLRYADDVMLGFSSKSEAHQASWRIQNYWWYTLGIRTKSREIRIEPIRKDRLTSFLGYRFKPGLTLLGKRTWKKLIKYPWPSRYLGLIIQTDSMKLLELTEKFKIKRKEFEFPVLDIKNLLGEVFSILAIRMRNKSGYKLSETEYSQSFRNMVGETNWIELIIELSGKKYSVSGNYPGIIGYLKQNIDLISWPLTEVEIENNHGYIFKGSIDYGSN